MKASDLPVIVRGVVPILREFVAAKLSDFADRLSSMEKDLSEGLSKVRDGKDGAQGLKGDQGQPGPAGDPGASGRDGKDGEPGSKGDPGEPGPQGLPGRDGANGLDGNHGATGPKGDPGLNGIDGKSFTLEDVQGVLDLAIAKALLDVERRSADVMQRAVDRLPVPKDGKDGEKGSDGKDGLGFEDLEPEYDEVGRLYHSYSRGDVVKRALVPGIVYRELFKEGTAYLKGDTVTWGGGMWTALEDNDGSVKPDEQPKNGKRIWALSVMRGRQGSAGQKGEQGDPGINGRDGQSITREKW